MNGQSNDDALRQRTDAYLARVRAAGQQSMAAIGEAMAESARRMGRRRHDPVAELTEAILPSLRQIEQEARRAIARVEAMTEEWERNGREQVVVVSCPADAWRGKPVQHRDDPSEAPASVPGSRPDEPESA